MILDMNLKLSGVDKEFLEELDELIEESRVEYFIINPKTEDEVNRAIKLCKEFNRFKYTLPVLFKDKMDMNCIAYSVSTEKDLDFVEDIPLVVDSSSLDESFVLALNGRKNRGVVLDAVQRDMILDNFALSISKNSLKSWSQKIIRDFDYNRLALQSDYPESSYDELVDGLLKDISDLTFRAEQTIAAGGTRTVLKTFELL